MPLGPNILWPEKARRSTPSLGHVDAEVRHGLAGVEDDERPDLTGAGDHRLDRVDGAEDVGRVDERDHLGPLVEQARRGRTGPGAPRR